MVAMPQPNKMPKGVRHSCRWHSATKVVIGPRCLCPTWIVGQASKSLKGCTRTDTPIATAATKITAAETCGGGTMLGHMGLRIGEAWRLEVTDVAPPG